MVKHYLFVFLGILLMISIGLLIGKSIFRGGELIITCPKMFIGYLIIVLMVFAPGKKDV